jgi:nicotinamidase-related amidase
MSTLKNVETLALPANDNPARRLLDAGRCVLVLVDIQQKLVPKMFNREQLIGNSRLLLRLAGIMNLPVLATTQYTKGLGPTVREITELIGNVRPHDKVEFSAYGSESFCGELEKYNNRDTLLVCGLETHVCVLQTAVTALNRGYTVHVVADAVGSRTEQNWRAGLKRMEDAGIVTSTTEMMIFELVRRSDSAAFKQMLPQLK